MTTYHVFECIDGDECRVSSHDTYADALMAMELLHHAPGGPNVNLSVQGRAGIVAWYDMAGTMRTMPAWKRELTSKRGAA